MVRGWEEEPFPRLKKSDWHVKTHQTRVWTNMTRSYFLSLSSLPLSVCNTTRVLTHCQLPWSNITTASPRKDVTLHTTYDCRLPHGRKRNRSEEGVNCLRSNVAPNNAIPNHRKPPKSSETAICPVPRLEVLRCDVNDC